MHRLLADDANAIDVSVSYALLWLSVVGGNIDPEQQHFLDDYLTNVTQCIQHREVFFQMLADNDQQALALACKVLGKKLSAEEKQYFLEQAINLTAFKETLTISENYALRFFADLLHLDAAHLAETYRRLTQRNLNQPGDPSRIDWWEGVDYSQLLTPEEIVARFTETRLTAQQACQVLGVSSGANDDEIKQAYRRLTQQFHPDREALSETDPEVARTMFSLVRLAYELLKEEGKS